MVTNFTKRKTIPVDFNPFDGPEIERVAPSTEPQTEIWLACLLGGDPANRSYNLSNSLRFYGPFDPEAMAKAIQDLLNRHESLRSVISANGEYIYIYKNYRIDFPFQDLSKKTPDQKEKILADYRQQEASYVFDLSYGPLVKVGLFKVQEEEYELILTTHHLISDGWSTSIFLHELGVLYSSFVKGIAPDLPEAPSFAQYSKDQRQFATSVAYQQTEEYWLNLYKEKIPSFDLPTDFPRPSVRTFESNRLDYVMEPQLAVAVKKMGSDAGCSFATTLLAAFEVLIHRLTGKNDIIIGLPTAGQAITEYAELVGHCVNLLPLRSQIDMKYRFLDLLIHCKKTLMDAHEHQRLTFGNLLKKLNIPRDRSRIPLVPIIFNFNRTVEGVAFEGVDYQYATLPKPYENFELFFNISADHESVAFEWTYNTQLFKAETIDRIMAGFTTILETVVTDPSISINDIVLNPEQNPSNNPTQAPTTQATYPFQSPIHQLIAQTASRFPDKTAIRFENRQLSYREVDKTANQLAQVLIQKGIRPGDLVGISVDRSPEMVITLLAVMKAGAAYLPLDPEFPHERLAYMLEDSAAKLVITSKKVETVLETDTPKILLENALIEAKSYGDEDPKVAVSGHDLAYVLYTSGSTGKPKGVLIEHHSLVNFLWSMKDQPGITPEDTLLAITTISFDISCLDLFLPLLVGARIRLVDLATARDGRALLKLVEQEGITVLQATPPTFRMMLDSGWAQRFPLKVLCGGEAMSRDLATKLLPRTAEVWNLYGPTETTVWATMKQVTTPEQITVGVPIANTEVYILNESLQPVGSGEVGEIWIGGVGVGRGYLNRPDLTRERFVTNPFSSALGNSMYRTGDLGRWEENGEIQCLGRIDHQVKIRGYRIELGEIENTIGSIPEINDVVVVASEERPGDPQLIAYVVLDPSASATVSDGRKLASGGLPEQIQSWKQQIRQQLPHYMIPAGFVVLPKMPLTATGKVDRKALPKPVLDEPESQLGYMGPRTDVEKLVSDIWIKCLKLEKISVFDNFFELGGHSLIAVQIMTLLEQKTGKHLPLATLFEYSTIEKLASILHMNGRSVTWDSLVPIKPLGSKVPLYIVHGAGLHVLLFNTLALSMDPDQPVYGLQAKGINTEDKPLESIEEIAAYYIDAIRAQNPDGPYALAGYSFGGIIAYEMAKQLLAQGKQVNMLGMFDTYAHQSNYNDPWLHKTWANAVDVIKQRLFLLTLLKENPRETISSLANSVQQRLTRVYRKIRYNEDHLKIFHGNYYKVNEANSIASRKYRLLPQEIEITLFRAKKRSYFVDDFEFLGWRPFALKGVKVHEVPGDHMNLFTPPNDKEFARILQTVLDQATSS